MSEPRRAHQLIGGAVGLYLRYPWIFLTLAAGVIVPYQVIVLVATDTGPFSQGSLGAGTASLLMLIDWVLIGPLVSALHVHAVREVSEERDPRLGPVTKQGLRVLPVAAAASAMAGLGIVLGLLAFIVPGVILMLRWFVVAQAAAIENEGWIPALRRSHELTQGNYGHVLVFSLYTGAIVTVPTLLVGLGFDPETTTAASFLVGVVLNVIVLSFAALATALLYYDLRQRRELASAARRSAAGPGDSGDEHASHSLDPRLYTDQERPAGWYVNPEQPSRMRYWNAGEPHGWMGTTATPRAVRREWDAEGETGA